MHAKPQNQRSKNKRNPQPVTNYRSKKPAEVKIKVMYFTSRLANHERKCEYEYNAFPHSSYSGPRPHHELHFARKYNPTINAQNPV